MSKKRLSVFIADHQYFGEPDYFRYEVMGFQKAGIDVCFGTCITEADLIEQGQRMDAILLCNNPPMGARAFASLPECKLVLRYGVGYNSIDVAEATRHGKLVLYMPGYCAEEVATHAASLILALNRHTVFHDRQVRSGTWAATAGYKLRRLSSQTLGLFGLGASGKLLARQFAQGWQMRVMAVDPYISAVEAQQHGVTLVDFEQLLREADIISIHAPINKATHHRFSTQEFEKMKPSSMIVNVSRGAIIDQKALIQALQQRTIQAAGLDVFEEEPIHPADPLLVMDNVILTPHSAYYSEDATQRQHEIAVRTVVQALQGQIPDNLVNPEVVKMLKW